MSYFIISLVSFLSFLSCPSASKVVVIDGYDVRFRSSPTTNSTIITSYNAGYELSLLNENAGSGNGCNKAWYQASNGSQVGYICSEFAYIKEVQDTTTTNTNTEYSEQLRQLGFPETYIPYLTALHNNHPNWQFKVFNATVDFNKMVSIEYDEHSRGWSLIEDTGSYKLVNDTINICSTEVFEDTTQDCSRFFLSR